VTFVTVYGIKCLIHFITFKKAFPNMQKYALFGNQKYAFLN